MKLVSFKYNSSQKESCGILLDNTTILDLEIQPDFKILNTLSDENKKHLFEFKDLSIDEVSLLSPILYPKSLRDAYAFRQHVEAGRKSRGLDMIPEYDQFPVFYYGNHNAIGGPGEVQIQKDQSIKLDYELEIAAIIGKEVQSGEFAAYMKVKLTNDGPVTIIIDTKNKE